MKTFSEKQALLKLQKLKNDYRTFLRQNYEHRAKDCGTCETQGACCLDAHFVNVHITRLEAVLIKQELEKLSSAKKVEIEARIVETIKKYDIKAEGDTFAQTFACPLFEKGVGCLVHQVKPVPCIQHACYERRADLPPDKLQTGTEEKIERLNKRSYGQNPPWLPLPLWLKLIN